MNTKQQGDIGVAHAIYYYTLRGFIVSIPNTDNSPYDLIVDKHDGTLYRVQCKTTFFLDRCGVYKVSLKTSGGNQSWNKEVKRVTKDKADILWVSDKEENGYEFPPEVFDGRTTINLGVSYQKYKVI